MAIMNSLVISFGASLRGFFEYCEEQNGVKADDLNNLFSQYFALDSVPKAEAKKAEAKKAPKKTVKDIELSDSEDDDASKKKAPAKKAPAKAPARKPSGKSKDAKPRDEQTPLGDLDLNKKKLPELVLSLLRADR